MVQIVDLSHYDNKGVDWEAMFDGGIRYVILKCTEGMTNTDPTYQTAFKAAKAAGLKVWSYVFEHEAGDVGLFLSVAHLGPGDGQPIVDAEAAGLGRLSVFVLMGRLAKKGFKPILYASVSYWRDVLGSPVGWPLWLAEYNGDGSLPHIPGAVIFGHQYTDRGTCPGVPKPCDMSRAPWTDPAPFLIAA